MSFNGDGTKFTGDDGFVQYAVKDSEIAGDGATPLPAPGVYLVTKVAAVSSFPSTALSGEAIAPGDFLVLKAGDSITPAIDDDVISFITTDQCDLSSFQMEFTKEEIEVTTLCDLQKKYRAGKADMAGTLNGIFTAGISDATDGILRQFLRIVKQDGDQSFDSFAQQEAILLGFFYINNDLNIADDMYVVAAFQIYGTSLGGEIGSAQSFSASFRFATKSFTDSGNGVTVEPEPTFYRLGDGT